MNGWGSAMERRDWYSNYYSSRAMSKRRYDTRLSDAIAVIADQRRHIKLLEDQLLPHIGHEVEVEQEAFL